MSLSLEIASSRYLLPSSLDVPIKDSLRKQFDRTSNRGQGEKTFSRRDLQKFIRLTITPRYCVDVEGTYSERNEGFSRSSTISAGIDVVGNPISAQTRLFSVGTKRPANTTRTFENVNK